MNKNLSKRIFTSFFLLIILSISLFINKYLWLIVLIVVSVISFKEFCNLSKRIWERHEKLIFIINGISCVYLILFVYIGYDIYKTPPLDIVYILLICIFSDTGGFLIGKLLGGKKLTKISPNKTISGSIGSFLFSLFPIIIFLLIYKFSGNNQFSSNISYTSLLFLSLFLSLVCQLGDLLISYFKRRAKVKDTGSILPGHGGLLDRIDGVIFVLPAAYIVDKLFL